MTVQDLILELLKLPKEMNVVIDVSSRDSEMIRLVSVDDASVIETSENDEFVLLSHESDDTINDN